MVQRRVTAAGGVLERVKARFSPKKQPAGDSAEEDAYVPLVERRRRRRVQTVQRAKLAERRRREGGEWTEEEGGRGEEAASFAPGEDRVTTEIRAALRAMQGSSSGLSKPPKNLKGRSEMYR